MDELKPCPFCGRTPTVDDCGDHRYFVRCKCGIAQDKLYAQKCDAVRRWNTRKTWKFDKDTNVPSNDTIYRQAAIEAAEAISNTDIRYVMALKALPAAQPDLSSYSDKLWRAAYERGKAEGQRKTSAQPQRMWGRWMEITASDCTGYDPTLAGYDDPVVGYVCSTCHEGYEKKVMGEVTWNYCPNCGADMREEQDEID